MKTKTLSKKKTVRKSSSASKTVKKTVANKVSVKKAITKKAIAKKTSGKKSITKRSTAAAKTKGAVTTKLDKKPKFAAPPIAPAPLTVTATESDVGTRADKFIAGALPNVSRSQLRKWLDDGLVTRDDATKVKPSELVVVGATYHVQPPTPTSSTLERQALDLDVLFEDKDVIVINKPAGLTVHPSSTQRDGTLVNALLARDTKWSTLSGVERPGIVHRLDKNTSGVLIIAKHDRAHRHLVELFSERKVDKRYIAFVHGVPPAQGEWNLPIGRHPTERMRFSTKATTAKAAHTRYVLAETYDQAAMLRIELLTGRTHQIRVHSSDGGHPILGDKLYLGRRRGMKHWPEEIRAFPRQALHAEELTLELPSGKTRTFTAPLPKDLVDLRAALRSTSRH